MDSENIGPFCKYLNRAMQIWKIKISSIKPNNKK